ncbi:AHH domain-containing protein, partial [Myxococcus sp. AM009]|uniref:AHH domain-containing protein n=1 Tax=Myxococcus sp. AM009 TaxID=2745137 RepID=UPI001595CA65
AKAPRLPGSAQAALNVEVQAGYRYAALGSVESVAMTAEGFTVALAPHAVAMTAGGTDGARRTQKHHIATNKNDVSKARGGPWTPRFKAIFKRAGMELKDPENIVPVAAHRGPHPREYHEQVLFTLEEATSTCRTIVQCREALTRALNRLAREVTTPGTRLNTLVTSGSRR